MLRLLYNSNENFWMQKSTCQQNNLTSREEACWIICLQRAYIAHIKILRFLQKWLLYDMYITKHLHVKI